MAIGLERGGLDLDTHSCSGEDKSGTRVNLKGFVLRLGRIVEAGVNPAKGARGGGHREKGREKEENQNKKERNRSFNQTFSGEGGQM